ncbi:WxL domain-containing protein [Lacticaseibacillus absianus]|uniref:WxL domain-containing protein n=1 Tax=Lacticaseibacillus absianus TaxID=2729623 RepID=UPI0015CE9FC7|nr:WxL domain-containing protein [Lacticaseibacillus absianus]
MKTVKLAAITFASVLALSGVLAGGASVSAATVDEPSTQTGTAYVTFTKTTPTAPLDPNDPTGTPDHGDDNSTGEVGALTLDAIPARLNFGTHEATTGAVDLTLNNSAAPATPNSQGDGLETTDEDGLIYTQVTNLMSPDVTWSLAAQLSEFSTADGAASLPQAVITLGSGQNQLLSADGTAWEPQAALTNAAIALTAGGASVTYLESNQAGTTQQYWNTDDVSLAVPAGAQTIGDSTATMTWTLSAVVN